MSAVESYRASGPDGSITFSIHPDDQKQCANCMACQQK